MTRPRATVGFIAASFFSLLLAVSAQDQRTLAETDCPCSCSCSYSYSFDGEDEPPKVTGPPVYAPTPSPTALPVYAPTSITVEPSPAPQQQPCVCGTDAEPTDTDTPVCDEYFKTDERGRVIIEMETVPIVDNWVFGSSIDGFSGDGYYEYVGANKFREPGTSELVIPIKFTVPGTFQIEWHSFIVVQEANTEHNDQFMKVIGGQIYGYKEIEGGNESFVYPACDQLDPEVYPVAEGFTADCYLKVYRNGKLDKWEWLTKTSDEDAHDVFVDIEEAGTYTLVISARSQGHAIDKIILHQIRGLKSAKVPGAAETICTEPEEDESDTNTNQTIGAISV